MVTNNPNASAFQDILTLTENDYLIHSEDSYSCFLYLFSCYSMSSVYQCMLGDSDLVTQKCTCALVSESPSLLMDLEGFRFLLV